MVHSQSDDSARPAPPAGEGGTDDERGRSGFLSYRPAPDVWDEMPVTPDGFDVLPRPPGWKYERWDDRLRLEPDWRYEIARWTRLALDHPAPPGVRTERLTADDLDAAVDAADSAFADGPDFLHWPTSERRRHLWKAVADALYLEPPWVRVAHRLARESGGAVVGLLLVREVAGGVCLDTVGVVPAWRRRGLAAAMFIEAVEALPEATEVRSGWLVANRESGVWHRRVGFEVLPKSVSMQSHVSVARWDLGAGRGTREAVAEAQADVERLREAEEAGRSPDPFTFTRSVHRRPTA